MAYKHRSGPPIGDGISKAGLDHLTVVLATEFARRDIPVRVNTIIPGYFASQLVKDGEELNEFAKTPRAGTIGPPLMRGGKQEEMIMAAVYLGSSGGGYSNGATLRVDGGWGIVNL